MCFLVIYWNSVKPLAEMCIPSSARMCVLGHENKQSGETRLKIMLYNVTSGQKLHRVHLSI